MYTGEILELVEKKSIELEKLFGCKIVDIDKVSKYLGIDVDTVKDLINDGSIPCFNKNKYLFLLSDIVKFMLGIQDEVTVNSGRNNIGMVQFPYNILEDISEEDFNMAIQTYGEGSVYWNEKRKCFQMAFYLDIGGEKKRKVIS